MPGGTGWKESFLRGTLQAETELLERFEREINRLQDFVAKRADGVLRRGFHAKATARVPEATFAVSDAIPVPLRVGFFEPGKSYPAVVRFSNSISEVKPDRARQGRGIAMRIGSAAAFHDLLLSNSPASHARDAFQFMALASALTNDSKIRLLIELVRSVGIFEAVRILVALFKTSGNIASVATESYWSRTAYAFGPCAARLVLKPSSDSNAPVAQNFDDLNEELCARLKAGSVRFDLFAQLYLDEARTPIEDGSVRWEESDSPPVPVGSLTLPSQDLLGAAAVEPAQQIEDIEFNPWNVQGDIRPLGSLNRARRVVYQASAARRRR